MGDRCGYGEEEFEEEEVWASVKERVEESPKSKRRAKDVSPNGSSSSRRLSTPLRMIPRLNANGGGGGGGSSRSFQQSAPVNIPDWSKIYSSNGGYGEGSERYGVHANFHDDDDDDDDEDGDKMPPHEWIAKKLARSQISSFSVCEGAGRTLKGRDLSKVRNAVLTRTGFLE